MFIERLDLLRCTRPHEDSWLVAAFHEMRDRNVIEGLLSCPVCKARYPITRSIAHFDVEPSVEVEGAGMSTGSDAGGLAAYLNLVEPGVVLLCGEWASAADGLAAFGTRVIALNAANGGASSASHIRCGEILPVARESLDGVALSVENAALVDAAAWALKIGARMVAPAGFVVPDQLDELARDAKSWVAVRGGTVSSAPVQIARR